MIRILINPDIYSTPLERDRVRMIYATTLTLVVLFTLYALFVTEQRIGATAIQSLATDSTSLMALISVYSMGILTLVATWRGWRRISGFGPGLIWYFSGIQIALQEGFVQPGNGVSLVVLILLTGLLMREPGVIIGYVAALVTLLFGFGRGEMAAGGEYAASELLTMILQVTGIAILIYLFLRSTQLTRSEAMTRASEERLKLANISTQIAQRVSRRLDLSDVLDTTVEQIRESYPIIYHVQIFLIDDNRTTARLAASTGDIGRLLLRRQHSLGVGSQSVIGRVTVTNEPVIARAGDANTVHRRNEFLPETVAEAAFPLRIGDNIIGALDLQSRVPEAFPENELPIFQSLADNIAIAIDNARLAGQTEQRLLENQRLVEQMRGAVQEVERLNQQLTGVAWSEYLTGREDALALTLDLRQHQTQRDSEWTPGLVEAVQHNSLVQQRAQDEITVAVPLRVRGQVIGAMEFELEDAALTPEDVNLIETVGERLGLALESARLYDESRRVAQREAALNEIGSRLQSSNNVDAVLNEAARSLQTTLGAQRVAIRLGTPQGSHGNGTP